MAPINEPNLCTMVCAKNWSSGLCGGPGVGEFTERRARWLAASVAALAAASANDAGSGCVSGLGSTTTILANSSCMMSENTSPFVGMFFCPCRGLLGRRGSLPDIVGSMVCQWRGARRDRSWLVHRQMSLCAQMHLNEMPHKMLLLTATKKLHQAAYTLPNFVTLVHEYGGGSDTNHAHCSPPVLVVLFVAEGLGGGGAVLVLQ